MKNFISSGKKGDLLMSLYVIREMGGGNLYLVPGEFEETLESVVESCGSLINRQDYIGEFSVHSGQHVDVDLDEYRKSPMLYRRTLLDVMCSAQGVALQTTVTPWIDAEPDKRFLGKVVLHRRMTVSARRVNAQFDWDRLIAMVGVENCVFVSRLENEWHEFGRPDVEYYKPYDNLEHASILKACKLYIGNQSFPSALADSVGADRIFELSTGVDRKHFAIRYADNVWYFANPWDCTIKHFKYLRDRKDGSYVDISTRENVQSMECYSYFMRTAIVDEMAYLYDYGKALIKRFIKNIVDRRMAKT